MSYESAEGTRIAESTDPPIFDQHGGEWMLDTERGLVLRNGEIQSGISHVDALLYQGRAVLAHRTVDHSWYIRGGHGRWLLTPNPAPQQDQETGAVRAMILKLQNIVLQGLQVSGASLAALTFDTTASFTAQGEALAKIGRRVDEIADTAVIGINRLGQQVGSAARSIDAIVRGNDRIYDRQEALIGRSKDAFEQISVIHQHVHGLPDALSTLASGIEAVQQGIEQILQMEAAEPPDMRAVSVRFVVPYILHPKTRERMNMAVNIIGDAITVIPIEFDNVGGGSVPKPAGGTASVSIDNTAAFEVAMSDSGMEAEITPVQPPQIGAVGALTYTDVVDGQTLTAILADLTITQDTNAVSVHFRTDAITTRPLSAVAPATPAGGTPPAGTTPTGPAPDGGTGTDPGATPAATP